MLLTSFAPDLNDEPYPVARRRSSRIVWQQRYDGIATVAYQGGKAIACISGPWSDRYALTWWVHQPSSPQLELFDSVEAARQAVMKVTGQEVSGRSSDPVSSAPPDPDAPRRTSWLSQMRALLRRRRAPGSLSHTARQLRQRYLNQDTDLSGMHFRACR